MTSLLRQTRSRVIAALSATAIAVLAFGCNSATDAGNVPFSVARVSGDSQTVFVGGKRTSPLVVVVKNEDGSPFPGAPLNWSITKGGGALDSAAVIADGSGTAHAVYVTSDTAGTATIRVVSGRGAIEFTVKMKADTVGTLSAVSGNGTAALTGSAVTLIAKAADRFGNAIPNVAVSWSASSGSLSNPTATTDTTGRATAVITLGATAGRYVVTATSRFNAATFNLDAVKAP